jgi:hypothetical protein
MTICEQITERFPIRKTAAQKKVFRQWLMGECVRMGYTARIEENDKGRQQNIIVGDPEHAEVTFTAHYDTPSTVLLPDLHIPRNFPVYLLWQAGMIGGMLAFSLLIGLALGLLTRDGDLLILGFFGAFVALMWLQLNGVANKHNVNDNTSGVVTVLEILRSLPENQRQKVAFVLFDLEEAGLLGSAAYRKAHPESARQLVMNLDCVGEGDALWFIPSKAVKADEGLMEALSGLCQSMTSKSLHLHRKGLFFYPSDQLMFPKGLAVAAFRHHKFFGPYLGKIHTGRDRTLDVTNVNILRAAIITLISQQN